jgi:hypothetical protein
LEVSGQLHAPAALPPGKSPRYPFYRRFGGPQSRSGRYGEVKIFYPTGTRTPAHPLVNKCICPCKFVEPLLKQPAEVKEKLSL